MPLQPDEIERQHFAVRLRGFDPDEVRAFLKSLADDLRAASAPLEPGAPEDPHELLDQAKHLAADVVEEAERRAARIEGDARARAEAIEAEAIAAAAPAPDAAAPQEDLGEQIAAVLATANSEAESTVLGARAEAERIVARANAEAERIVTRARAEADHLRAEARPTSTPTHDPMAVGRSDPNEPAADTWDEPRRPRAVNAGGEERSAVATEAIRAIVKLVLEVDHGRGSDPAPQEPMEPAPPARAAADEAPPAVAILDEATSPSDRASGDLERDLRSEFARRHGPDDGISGRAQATHPDRVAAEPDDHSDTGVGPRDPATESHAAIDGTTIDPSPTSASAPNPPAPDWTRA